jgi:hypothetical protein
MAGFALLSRVTPGAAMVASAASDRFVESRFDGSWGAPVEARMTIVSKASAFATLPDIESGTIIQQLSRRIGSIFQRLGAQLMRGWLRLKTMHELDRLNGDMLRDIGQRRVNLPGATPGLPGGTTGRFVRWSSLEPWSD